MSSESIVILRGDKPAAKRVTQLGNGKVQIHPSGSSFRHSVDTVAIGSLANLYSVLSDLQDQSDRFVIRGKLINGMPTEGIRRLLKPTGDDLASFEPAPRRWVMLDIDGIQLPAGMNDFNGHADEIIAHAISFLPDQFQTASCVYQWSGSMGFKTAQIRIHLWFWLDRPVSDEQLKAWMQNSPVDRSLFNPVQVHYTANPILEDGAVDPITQRVGLYMPKAGSDTVVVPELSSFSASENVRQYVSSGNSIEPQEIVRDPVSDLVINGRERFLFFKSKDATKALMVGRSRQNDVPSIEEIAALTWTMFQNEADISDAKWGLDDAVEEAARRHNELVNQTYSYVSRADTTMLEPCDKPYVNIQIFSKEDGQKRLSQSLSKFFGSLEQAPRMALRITMGAGKTRATIRHLQDFLAQNYFKSIEIYVPRHDLAEQYINDILQLEDGFCADVIHVLPRVSVNPSLYPDTCNRPEYARSLNCLGLGVFQNACRSNDGDLCEHYDSCRYLGQFAPASDEIDNHGNIVRIFAHTYLGLPRNPVQSDPDLVIIDEAFLGELIDTKTSITPADIKSLVKTHKYPKLGRWIVDALEYGDPLLKSLKDQGVTRDDLSEVNLDELAPSLPFTKSSNLPINRSGNVPLLRSLALLLRILKEEMALNPAREDVERLVYDPDKDLIRIGFLKSLEFPCTIPILCLDATADEMLLSEVLGNVTVENIHVEQNATILQVFDRTGSSAFWNGKTAPVNELVNVANAWLEFGEKPLIVSHKEMADRLRSHPQIGEGVQVMHLGGLRGSNAAEDRSVIFLTGRLQPPMEIIDLQGRAMFWSANDPLQHDEGSQFKVRGAKDLRPPEAFRGFIQSKRNTSPQSGVRIMSFSDRRIDVLLAQTRDAETMQALGRLRLVHSQYRKRVYLLSNLPVEVPIDGFVQFNDLMPGKLELELMKHGNIPLTPLGILKMRPDLASGEEHAKSILKRSNLVGPKALAAMPDLVRSGMMIIEFEAENAGRWNKHKHLFILKDQQAERLEEAQSVQISSGSIPFQAWVRLLENGDPDLDRSSGWGAIRNPRLVFS